MPGSPYGLGEFASPRGGRQMSPSGGTPSAASLIKRSLFTNEDILRAEIPWATYQSAGIISKGQLELIYQLDKQPLQRQVEMFGARGPQNADMYIALLTGVTKDEPIMYIVTMLEEILVEKPALAAHFHAVLVESNGCADPFAPLMKLLSWKSAYILEKSVALLTKLFGVRFAPDEPGSPADEAYSFHLSTFCEWVLLVLKAVNPLDISQTDALKVGVALSALQQLVSTPWGRAACVAADGLVVLITLMSGTDKTNSSSVQMLYQVVFCVWSLSYSPEASAEMVASKMGLVAKLVDIVRVVQKEKVVRVALATLRNLLGTGNASAEMVGAGVMNVLDHLGQKKWADEDILVDVQFLAGALQDDLTTLSSWDVYKKEVFSGKLEWSPSHKSENFWKHNHKAFELGHCAVIKQLISLLGTDEPTTLAVACSDISKFIEAHPEGRRLMTQFGAKQQTMGLLQHSNHEVKKYALTAVQRLMVINWEYLGSKAV